MKKKIFKLFLSFEKEEEWIRKMSKQGLHLIKRSSPVYIFEEASEKEYCYRTLFLGPNTKEQQKQECFEHLADIGVEVISKAGHVAYLRRSADQGSFDISSDLKFRIQYYQRLIFVWAVISLNPFFRLIGLLPTTFPFRILNFALLAVILALLFSYYKSIKKLKTKMILKETP